MIGVCLAGVGSVRKVKFLVPARQRTTIKETLLPVCRSRELCFPATLRVAGFWQGQRVSSTSQAVFIPDHEGCICSGSSGKGGCAWEQSACSLNLGGNVSRWHIVLSSERTRRQLSVTFTEEQFSKQNARRPASAWLPPEAEERDPTLGDDIRSH